MLMKIRTGSFGGFYACCLQGFFGKCSGRVRGFPKPSRRNPGYFPKKTGLQQAQTGSEKQNGFGVKKGDNGQKPKFPYTVPKSEISLLRHRIFVRSGESTGETESSPGKWYGFIFYNAGFAISTGHGECFTAAQFSCSSIPALSGSPPAAHLIFPLITCPDHRVGAGFPKQPVC